MQTNMSKARQAVIVTRQAVRVLTDSVSWATAMVPGLKGYDLQHGLSLLPALTKYFDQLRVDLDAGKIFPETIETYFSFMNWLAMITEGVKHEKGQDAKAKMDRFRQIEQELVRALNALIEWYVIELYEMSWHIHAERSVKIVPPDARDKMYRGQSILSPLSGPINEAMIFNSHRLVLELKESFQAVQDSFPLPPAPPSP